MRLNKNAEQIIKTMTPNILPEFQKYLSDNKIVQSKNVPFYALWSSKFLSFSNKDDTPNLQLRIQKFIKQLKADPKISDWQINQAKEIGLIGLDTMVKYFYLMH